MAGEGIIAELFIKLGVDDRASVALGTISDKIGAASAEMSASLDEATAHVSGFGSGLDDTIAPTKSLTEQISGLSTGLYGVAGFAERGMHMLDRYEISQMNVENATNNLTKSQERYTETITKFGKDSPQARDALLSLENAQNAVDKANIRADMSVGLIGISVLGMVPQFLKATTAVTTFAASGTVVATMSTTVRVAMTAIELSVAGAMTFIQTSIVGLTAFLTTNPIGIAILLILAAIVALKIAWDNNWFSIQERVATAVAWIKTNFGWLIDGIDWVIRGLSKLTGAHKEATDAAGIQTVAISTTATALDKYALSTGTAIHPLGRLEKQLYNDTQEMNKLHDAAIKGAGSWDDYTRAAAKVKDDQEQLNTVISKTTTNINNQADQLKNYTAGLSSDAGISGTIIAAMLGAGYTREQILAAGFSGGTAAAGRKGSDELISEARTKVTTGAWNEGQAMQFLSRHKINRVGGGGLFDGNIDGGYWYDRRKINEMAKGGDFLVSRPTLFMAGEAGPERATFTPMNGSVSRGISIINNFNAPIYGIDDLGRAIDSAMERLKWNIRAAGG